ncbi:MAG: hypothetical protein ABIT83_09160 [Massilia sp.]
MSYDLMVFEPTKNLAQRQPFLDWYEQQTEWNEPHDHDDPSVCTPALQGFYADMQQTFPAQTDDTSDGGTDYTIAANLIYMSFAWDQIDLAHDVVSKLAAKHALGFFDVSSDLSEVWLPDRKGGLWIAHSD